MSIAWNALAAIGIVALALVSAGILTGVFLNIAVLGVVALRFRGMHRRLPRSVPAKGAILIAEILFCALGATFFYWQSVALMVPYFSQPERGLWTFPLAALAVQVVAIAGVVLCLRMVERRLAP